MKQTVNINLGGYAFVIEEDAYLTLSDYLDRIKSSLKDDAEEISNDIEERIAEILNEKCKTSQVVSLSMVEEAKKRIGTYLHGPILPKNPRVADFLIRKALENKTKKFQKLEPLNDALERKAHKSAAKRPR